MKKNIVMAMIAAIVFININATNCLNMGDSVRIHPNRLSGYWQHAVTMYIDGMANAWQVDMTYPDGLSPKLVAGVTALPGMDVTYLDRNGEEQIYSPSLNVSVQYGSLAAYIPIAGYWLIGGEYESYGTAKWMPGCHELFEFNFYVAPEFREGDVVFTGTISSGRDDRGPILQNVRFVSVTHVWVGYIPGDITGDGRHNVGDVTLLIDYLLDNDTAELDEFQVAACDADRDGKKGIADLSALIDMILTD